jgi:sigma-70-like protein
VSAAGTATPEVAVIPEDGVSVPAIDSGRSAADREWFECTVVALLSDLFGTALRLTRNRADAEDLVADTVARGWSHLDELADRTRLRGWLFRILTNTFLSARRTDARRGVHESLDDETEDGFSLFEQLHVPILLFWGTPSWSAPVRIHDAFGFASKARPVWSSTRPATSESSLHFASAVTYPSGRSQLSAPDTRSKAPLERRGPTCVQRAGQEAAPQQGHVCRHGVCR